MKKRLLVLSCCIGMFGWISGAEIALADQVYGEPTATVEMVGVVGKPLESIVSISAYDFKIYENDFKDLIEDNEKAENTIIKYSHAHAENVVTKRDLTKAIHIEELKSLKQLKKGGKVTLTLSVKAPYTRANPSDLRSPKSEAQVKIDVELLSSIPGSSVGQDGSNSSELSDVNDSNGSQDSKIPNQENDSKKGNSHFPETGEVSAQGFALAGFLLLSFNFLFLLISKKRKKDETS